LPPVRLGRVFASFRARDHQAELRTSSCERLPGRPLASVGASAEPIESLLKNTPQDLGRDLPSRPGASIRAARGGSAPTRLPRPRDPFLGHWTGVFHAHTPGRIIPAGRFSLLIITAQTCPPAANSPCDGVVTLLPLKYDRSLPASPPRPAVPSAHPGSAHPQGSPAALPPHRPPAAGTYTKAPTDPTGRFRRAERGTRGAQRPLRGRARPERLPTASAPLAGAPASTQAATALSCP